MTIEFGFGLITCQRAPGEGRSDAELYADALQLAAEAERLGFDSVWTSEHHFVDDGYLPSLLPMNAAIAARTERVRVGTGLLLAPLHDPIRIAEDAAVVDLLSGGRLILGVGIGWREEEFEGLGVPLAERAPRLEEAVAEYRAAWRGDPVGERIGRPNVPVRPVPARPGGPPIWIGGFADPAIRRAGRIGDGFMASDVTPSLLSAQVTMAREARAAAGVADELAISMHVGTLAWNGEDAWQRVREHHRYVEWKYMDMEHARGRTGAAIPPPPLGAAEEAALREQIVLGRPDEVAERIAAFADAAGGDLHYIARLYWPGMDPALQREAMAIFAEEVIPKLR